MQTDYNAPWRGKRFIDNPSDSPMKALIKRRYNDLADRAGADVAARWLAILHSGENETGLFVELAGAPALMNVYQDTAPQGDSALKNSVGIGADWVCPFIAVHGDEVLVGTPKRNKRGQTTGIKVTATYQLAA